MSDLYGFTENKERDAVINDNRITQLQNAINTLTNNINNYWKTVYPVGAIYMSVSQTNPRSIFGGGTWVAWGSGRVPVGVNTNDSNFNRVEKTGGSNTHAHWQTNGSDTNIFYDCHEGLIEDLNESDDFKVNSRVITGKCITVDVDYVSELGPMRQSQTYNASSLQPYITCYMWKRTA